MTSGTWLIFARCAGFAFRAPGFSHPSVPGPVRVGIALLLGLAASPLAPKVAAGGAKIIALLVIEFLIGSAIGLASSVLYDGAYAGGRVVDDYVGVKAIAPGLAMVAPSGFGRVWSIAFTGAYFVLGGYRYAIDGFTRSFVSLPPGTPLDPQAWSDFAVRLISTIVGVGCAVAGPAVALAFVTQIGLAALSRVIPRFSSFTLSFPIVFGVVVVVTAITLPAIALSGARPLSIFSVYAR